MSNKEDDIAISYYIEEIENENTENNFNIEAFMDEMNNTDFEDELLVPHMLNYNDNFTVKELLLICEYYGFAKDLKNNKCNKNQIISFLVVFESDPNNSEIVFKRQNMWFYMNELKSDKFMKKYVLW